MKVGKINKKSKAIVVPLCAFISLAPLACKSCLEGNDGIKKGGVVMSSLMRKSKVDEYKDASNKKEWMVDFVKSSASFAVCKSFMDEVLEDSSIGQLDKQLAIATVYRKYAKNVREYALKGIMDKKFLETSQSKLSRGDKDKVTILSEILATDEEYLKKYAKYVAEAGPTGFRLLSGQAKPPILGAYLAYALAFRSNLTDKKDAFRIANEIMKNTAAYSLHVNANAASAMLTINLAEGRKAVGKEIKTTLNPIKSDMLKEVLDEYKFDNLVPKKPPRFPSANP